MGNDEAYDPWATKHNELVLPEGQPTTDLVVQKGSKFGWDKKSEVSEFIDTWDSDVPVIWQDDLKIESDEVPITIDQISVTGTKAPEYIYNPSDYSKPLCGPSPWVKSGDVILPLDDDFILDTFPNDVLSTQNTKPSNPKDSVGIAKVPFSTFSAVVWAEVGLAMMEGARKYGRHNYREVGVLASVYYDATLRHLTDWYEGQDIDPASGLSHITKAIASLTVLRDSMIRENWVDDRPPAVRDGWMEELNAKAKEIIEKYPNPVPAFTNKERV